MAAKLAYQSSKWEKERQNNEKRYKECNGKYAAQTNMVSSFCTDKLIARGYAQSMNGMRRVLAPDGTLVEEKIYGQYAYLNYGCQISVTMKSDKRAIIEVFYVNKNRLNRWSQFTLTNTDKWRLADKKQKFHEDDKWKKDTL